MEFFEGLFRGVLDEEEVAGITMEALERVWQLMVGQELLQKAGNGAAVADAVFSFLSISDEQLQSFVGLEAFLKVRTHHLPFLSALEAGTSIPPLLWGLRNVDFLVWHSGHSLAHFGLRKGSFNLAMITEFIKFFSFVDVLLKESAR